MKKIKNKMKILVDMDNTLNEMSEHFIDVALNFGWDVDYINGYKSYDLSIFFNTVSKTEAESRVNKIFHSKNFFFNIPIKEFAYSVMNNLVVSYDVWIVTAPLVNCDNYVKDKYKWIMKNLPFFDLNKVIFEKEKWNIEGDIIIDDKPEIINKYPGITICFKYPYNIKVNSTYKVNSWREIEKILL